MDNKIKLMAFIVVLVALQFSCEEGPQTSFLEMAGDVCYNDRIEEAATYQSSPQTHTILIFDDIRRNLYDMPEEWAPESINSLELVACLSDEEVLINTCEYPIGPNVEYYQRNYVIRVVEAKTGNIVEESIVFGEDPGNCKVVEYFSVTKIEGSYPTRTDVLEYLSSITNQPVIIEE